VAYSECQIVPAHSRLRSFGMTLGILVPNILRKEKANGCDGVAYKAEHVNGEIIEGQASDGFASEVADELRVEGYAPAQEVGPAEQARHGVGEDDPLIGAHRGSGDGWTGPPAAHGRYCDIVGKKGQCHRDLATTSKAKKTGKRQREIAWADSLLDSFGALGRLELTLYGDIYRELLTLLISFCAAAIDKSRLMVDCCLWGNKVVPVRWSTALTSSKSCGSYAATQRQDLQTPSRGSA
jgi:hypothetical protein